MTSTSVAGTSEIAPARKPLTYRSASPTSIGPTTPTTPDSLIKALMARHDVAFLRLRAKAPGRLDAIPTRCTIVSRQPPTPDKPCSQKTRLRATARHDGITKSDRLPDDRDRQRPTERSRADARTKAARLAAFLLRFPMAPGGDHHVQVRWPGSCEGQLLQAVRCSGGSC